MIIVSEQKQELFKLLQLLHHIEATEILGGVIDPNELKQKREQFEWDYKQALYKLSTQVLNKGNARPYTPANQN